MEFWLYEGEIKTTGATDDVREKLRQFSAKEFDNKWGQHARLTLAELDLNEARLDE